LTVGVTCLLAPAFARAQTCDAYSHIRPDGKQSQVFSSSATTDHVSFFFIPTAGRSYSIEVLDVGRHYQTGTFLPVNVNVGNCPTSNMAGLRDTTAIEPTIYALSSGARFSVTAASASPIQFRAGSPAASSSGDFQARVTDTTLFSNWFFLGGDYSAFTLIRNTTNAAVQYTVNWRSNAGAIVGTTSGSIVANGSAIINARDIPGALAAGSGTVEITHDAPPSAIVASTTVLSGTTGLSFDAPFATRQP